MQLHAYSLRTNFTSKISNARIIKPYTPSLEKRDTTRDRRYSLGFPSSISLQSPALPYGMLHKAQEKDPSISVGISERQMTATIPESGDDLKVLTDA